MSNDIRRRPEGALLRTYLTAAGVSPESFEKPIIGVATVSTQVFSENPDAKELGTATVKGIEKSGGIAVRWDTVRSPDQITWGHADGYSFAWRDQLADFIESWAKQQSLDGLVLVGDAPETLVGMAMAAARLNLPAIMVTTGAQRWEYHKTEDEKSGKASKNLSSPYELMVEVLFSKKKGDEKAKVEALEKCLLAEDDHEAYAMDLILEGLGLCLPGMSTAPVQSPRRQELAEASGSRIINLVKTGTTVRRVLTQNAFSNGIRLNAALGGSVDAAVHLMALAHEAGQKVSLDTFDRIASETPQLCSLGGVSSKQSHRIEDLDRAGGVWAIMHTLKSQISPTTTLSGKGAMELAKASQVKDSHVIHSTRPIKKQSGIGVVKGNLAPNGAVYLLNQAVSELSEFTGPVAIFDDEIAAAQAVSSGEVKKGTALVVRGQGPKGGPGLRKLRILPALLADRGLNKTIPLLTDGRLPDQPAGLFISLLSPEGAAKGPLSVLKNDDVIMIDMKKKQIGVRLTDTDLRIRLARWQSPEPQTHRGFLSRYSRLVSEVAEGAVLK